MKTYAEKLRDPRWQRKRLEIFERDKFKCVLCGATDIELHVHHLNYKKGSNPWESDLDSLVTMCKLCHEDVSQLLEAVAFHIQYREYLIALKQFHFVMHTELPISDVLQDMMNALGLRKN